VKQETVSGSSISWAVCKSAPRFRQIGSLTTPAPDHSVFLQAGCPSCRLTNSVKATGVNPAGDAGDTSPPIFWLGGTSMEISPPILLRTFGYSRPILVALRSLSLKPISFGYETPPIRFNQAGGQSAHKARPPQP